MWEEGIEDVGAELLMLEIREWREPHPKAIFSPVPANG